MKEVKNFKLTTDVIDECLEECFEDRNSKKDKEKKTSVSSR
ncbi:hypothetical protein [Clostridium muellerianum]|nr:hypothetical protein [Clostridium muellerianum]